MDTLPQQVDDVLDSNRWGLQSDWQKIYNCLPDLKPTILDFNSSSILVGTSDDLQTVNKADFEAMLKELHPWRKGPFDIFGIHINTEWRSDWKWDRLKKHISPLDGKIVLDVGCGSGYHCWRMKGAGAKIVVGIEPMLKYIYQFNVFQKYIQDYSVTVLPLGIDDVPDEMKSFDTVFSMGVFYHRRSPFDHLLKLKSLLRPGGELVLETLVIDGDEGEILVPADRYAQMRNVWFLPSVKTLNSWLKRSGFVDVRCVNINKTSKDEQRSTDWMTFNSLADFLDPQDSSKTIEGYPAPQRAIFIAKNT